MVIVGIGAMGKGLIYQREHTPGIKCVEIADAEFDRAVETAEDFGLEYKIVETLDDLHDTIRKGIMAVRQNGSLLANCELADVFIEGSNSIIPAAQFSEAAIKNGMHLVLMNTEIDLIYGPYLLEMARANNVVYTSCDGDQHAVIKRIVDDFKLWGFEMVMSGNIKGFFDRYSNPTKIIPEADKRNLGYKMATAYTDGTKLCVEMALAANAMGLKTTIPGMFGPRAKDVHEVFELFDFEKLYADREPMVDYILGALPGGGVFAVGYFDNPYQMSMLEYYKMGNGPFYLFYGPYHLCHIESMECVVDASLNHISLMEPIYGLKTNVYTHAKKDLAAGETLDGVGGYATYGMIEDCGPDVENPGLPVFLAEDVVLNRSVKKDEKIMFADIDYDATRYDFVTYQKTVEASRRITKG